jgi:hypothetical protein
MAKLLRVALQEMGDLFSQILNKGTPSKPVPLFGVGLGHARNVWSQRVMQ